MIKLMALGFFDWFSFWKDMVVKNICPRCLGEKPYMKFLIDELEEHEDIDNCYDENDELTIVTQCKRCCGSGKFF